MARYVEDDFDDDDYIDNGPDDKWSAGGTLLFIMCSCSALWAAITMGVISIR